MKKFLILAAALLCCAACLSAAGPYMSMSVGNAIPLSGFVVSNGEKADVPVDEYFDVGLRTELSAGWNVTDWFSAGFTTGVTYNPSDIEAYDLMAAVPLTLDLTLSPLIGVMSFPVTLSAGGHAQFIDNSVSFGPYFAVSVAMLLDVTQQLSIGVEAKADLLMQFADDFDTISYQVGLSPMQLKLIYSF